MMRDCTQYLALIGAQKSGTTSLFRYLATHPDIIASPRKEGRLFLASVPTPEQFAEAFLQRTGERWCFEASTYYTKEPRYSGVPHKIHQVFPSARFVYLVRDPVERIWSQYTHYLAKDWERKPLKQAIRENDDYLDFSRYFLQLSKYLEVFPRENILVLIFEEFVQDKLTSVQKIFEFLDIDAGFQPPNLDQTYNSASTKRAMSPAKRLIYHLPGYRWLPWRLRHWTKTALGLPLPNKAENFTQSIRAQIAAELEGDIHKFVEFLGRDIPSWSCLNTSPQR